MARAKTEHDPQREAELLRGQIRGALKGQRAHLLFRRGKHLSISDFVGLTLANLDEVMGHIVVVEGKTKRINGRVLSQFTRLAKLLLDGLVELRAELQDMPESLEIRWTDFGALPDVTPEIPARIDDLFEGVLTKRAEAERHKLRPAAT